VEICDLGVIGYEKALCLQTELVGRRIEGKAPDTLLVVEHERVVTLGRTEKAAGIIDEAFFEKQRIPVISTGRGGKVTYHAPGQLVFYPVIDLGSKKRDISFYIDFLEKTAAKSLKRLGVPAERCQGKRGVWVEGKKIAFIGVAVKKWITFHGFAVNINNDITPFLHMAPCGESDIRVTSVKDWMGREADMLSAKEIFADQFVKDLEEEYGNKIT